MARRREEIRNMNYFQQIIQIVQFLQFFFHEVNEFSIVCDENILKPQ